MIKSVLVSPSNSKTLAIGEGEGGNTLISARYGELYGHFKTTIVAGATTQTVVSPYGDEAIGITDIITSMEKKNLALVTLKFSGGGSTAFIFRATLTDLPFNVGIPLAGRWQGWSGASIKLTNSLALVGSVSIGYYHIPKDNALTYQEWNKARR